MGPALPFSFPDGMEELIDLHVGEGEEPIGAEGGDLAGGPNRREQESIPFQPSDDDGSHKYMYMNWFDDLVPGIQAIAMFHPVENTQPPGHDSQHATKVFKPSPLEFENFTPDDKAKENLRADDSSRDLPVQKLPTPRRRLMSSQERQTEGRKVCVYPDRRGHYRTIILDLEDPDLTNGAGKPGKDKEAVPLQSSSCEGQAFGQGHKFKKVILQRSASWPLCHSVGPDKLTPIKNSLSMPVIQDTKTQS